MSRSYKKSPVHTDGHRKTTKWVKRIANHKVRQYNKNITNALAMRDPRYINAQPFKNNMYKKFFESWWIHDYISYWTKAQAVHEWEHPHWFYMWDGQWWSQWMDFTTKEQMEQYWAKYYRRK